MIVYLLPQHHVQVLSAVDAVAGEIDQAEREGVIASANSSKAVIMWRSFAYPILI
jgi:hypothetical protein